MSKIERVAQSLTLSGCCSGRIGCRSALDHIRTIVALGVLRVEHETVVASEDNLFQFVNGLSSSCRSVIVQVFFASFLTPG